MLECLLLLTHYLIILYFNVQNGDPKQGYRGGGKESNSISNELASAINDGLYFYEQVESPLSYVTNCQLFFRLSSSLINFVGSLA